MSASLAAPSTGAAARRTSSAPPRRPAIPLRPARGITRTANVTPSGDSPSARGASPDGTAPRSAEAIRVGARRRLSGLGGSVMRLARPMEQHLLLGLVPVADELQRLVERVDRGLE